MQLKNNRKQLFLICMLVQFLVFPAISQDKEENQYTYGVDGFRLVGNYFSDVTSFKSNWIAIDVEYSYLEPLQQVKYLKNGKWRKRPQFATSGMAWFQLGAEYNIENKNLGIRVGTFQKISFFSINPVQFIYNTGSLTRGFTYRPEIGIGYYRFQLNYAYNINFHKEISVMGKHLIVLRYHFPF